MDRYVVRLDRKLKEAAFDRAYICYSHCSEFCVRAILVGILVAKWQRFYKMADATAIFGFGVGSPWAFRAKTYVIELPYRSAPQSIYKGLEGPGKHTLLLRGGHDASQAAELGRNGVCRGTPCPIKDLGSFVSMWTLPFFQVWTLPFL